MEKNHYKEVRNKMTDNKPVYTASDPTQPMIRISVFNNTAKNGQTYPSFSVSKGYTKDGKVVNKNISFMKSELAVFAKLANEILLRESKVKVLEEKAL